MRRHAATLALVLLVACSDDVTSPTRSAPTPHPFNQTPAFAFVLSQPDWFHILPDPLEGDVIGISPNGTYIVGSYRPGHEDEAFVYNTATTTFLELSNVGALGMGRSVARAVNSGGTAVGFVGNPLKIPVYWRLGGNAHALPLPAGAASGTANDVGPGGAPIIVGTVSNGATTTAVYWTLPPGGAPTVTELTGTQGAANALNVTAGYIVGSVVVAGVRTAAAWEIATGALHELDVTGVAHDINSSGVIVGGTGDGRGFQTKVNGVAELSNFPGAEVAWYAINAKGAIAGTIVLPPLGLPMETPVPAYVFRSHVLLPDVSSGVFGVPALQGAYSGLSDSDVAVGTWTAYTHVGIFSLAGFTTIIVERDRDNDAVVDAADNCVSRANANQADGDTDGIGDLCDDDTPPIVALRSAPGSLVEGRAYAFAVTAYDPGGDPLTITWTFSDGTVLNGATVSHAFDEGDYTYTVDVRTSDAQTTTTGPAALATVGNVRPSITGVTPTFTLNSGDPVNLTFAVSDPGIDNVTWTVWWGDRTTDTGTCTECSPAPAAHVYPPGTYSGYVKGDDGDGGITVQRFTVTVIPLVLTAVLYTLGVEDNSIDLDEPGQETILVVFFGTGAVAGADIKSGLKLGNGTNTPVLQTSASPPVHRTPSDGITDREFTFSRSALVAGGHLTAGVTTQLIATGRLHNGVYFAATIPVTVEQ